MDQINKSRLFTASCMSLVVTSMSFAIRAGALGDMTKEFGLTPTEMATVGSIWALGFPIATTLGGFFVDALGMRRFMWLAVLSHALGILMTIFASGYGMLVVATFLVGFANGTVEAVCNPLIASMYTTNKTAMLNKFHVWFPGGIVVGSILGELMTNTLHLDWRMRMAILLIPTAIYAFMFFGQAFPKTERVATGVSTSSMISAVFSPLFLFMAFCMVLTANTELSTTQFVESLLGNAGAKPMVILILINGLMAAGRFFGGPIIHKLKPHRILLISSIIAALGIFLLKGASDATTVYAAAIIFAAGCCFFWPTMLGFVSENIPKSGALGLSLMGGAGMFGVSLFSSFLLGPKLASAKAEAAAQGLTDKALDLATGQSALGMLGMLPIILIAAFIGLLFYMKNKE
jgi:MFS family permease